MQLQAQRKYLLSWFPELLRSDFEGVAGLLVAAVLLPDDALDADDGVGPRVGVRDRHLVTRHAVVSRRTAKFT